MEQAILDKLIEMDKKYDKQTEEIRGIKTEIKKTKTELKEEIQSLRKEMKEEFIGVGNVFIDFDKTINKKFEEVEEEIAGVKDEIKNINEKVDIFYASDILNKRILNDHEDKIREIARNVGIEIVKKEKEIKEKNSIESKLNDRLRFEEGIRRLKS